MADEDKRIAEEQEREMTKARSMRIQSEKKLLLDPANRDLQKWLKEKRQSEKSYEPDYREAAKCLTEAELVGAYQALQEKEEGYEYSKDETARMAALNEEKERRQSIYQEAKNLSIEEKIDREHEIQEELQNENENLTPTEREMLEAEVEQVQNAEKKDVEENEARQQEKLIEEEEREEREEEEEEEKEQKEIEEEENPEKKEELEERKKYRNELATKFILYAASESPEHIQGALSRCEMVQEMKPEHRDKNRELITQQMEKADDEETKKWYKNELLLYDIADAEEHRGDGFAKWKKQQNAVSKPRAVKPQAPNKGGYQPIASVSPASKSSPASGKSFAYRPIRWAGEDAAEKAKDDGKSFLKQEGARVTAEAMAIRANFRAMQDIHKETGKNHVRFMGRLKKHIIEQHNIRRNAKIEKGRMYLEMMKPPEDACIYLPPLSPEQKQAVAQYESQKAQRKETIKAFVKGEKPVKQKPELSEQNKNLLENAKNNYQGREISDAKKYASLNPKDFEKMVAIMPEREFSKLRETATLLHANKLEPENPAMAYLKDPQKLQIIKLENRSREQEIDCLSDLYSPEELNKRSREYDRKRDKLNLSDPKNAKKAARYERQSDIYKAAQTTAVVKNTPSNELIATYATSRRNLSNLRKMGGDHAKEEAKRIMQSLVPIQKQLLNRGKSPDLEAANWWSRNAERQQKKDPVKETKKKPNAQVNR